MRAEESAASIVSRRTAREVQENSLNIIEVEEIGRPDWYINRN